MNTEEQDLKKETLRLQKLKADEAESLAKDQARTKAYLAKEQVIEKSQKIKEDQRAKDRLSENIKETAKDKARGEAYQDREKKIAGEQEARRAKDQKAS